MERNKEKIEILIDKAVLNTLSDNERSTLDKLIMEQPIIKTEIDLRRDIALGIEYAEVLELREELSVIHKKVISNRKTPFKIKTIIYWGLAACFVFGLLYKSGIMSDLEKPTHSELFATYFEPYDLSTDTRGANINDEEIETFENLYEERKYKDAYTALKDNFTQLKPHHRLSLGISAIQSEDYNLATQLFDDIINTNNYYFTDQARWYKSLALVKQGKIIEAKASLRPLMINKEADFHEQSVALFEAL